ncbi:MAG: hypothetical protein ACAI25_17720, partial [Planctomycetota bacterium]
MRTPFLLAALGFGLAVCVTDDKISGEREAIAVIREVFETRVRGDGTPREVARVASITRAGVEWADLDEAGAPGATRRLAWADLEDVEYQQHQESPAHPEALYLYLARGSPSVETSGAIQPPLSGAEVVRCYVLLRDRPRGSRSRLVRAVRELGKSARVAPLPVARKPEVAQPTSASMTTEQKLQRLKELHDKGLITDQVYADEQRRILSQGY